MTRRIVTKPMMRKIQSAFERMLESGNFGDSYERLTFGYKDVIEYSNGNFAFASDVSGLMKAFEAINYVVRLRRGTQGVKSEFNIAKLMNSSPIRVDATGPEPIIQADNKFNHRDTVNVPESSLNIPESEEEVVVTEEEQVIVETVEEAVEAEVVEPVLSIPVVAPEVIKVSREEFKNEIREMVTFMQSIPKQMVGSLTEMLTQLDSQDPAYVAELENMLDNTLKERDQARKEKEDALFEVAVLKEQLRSSNGISDIDLHELYRVRNSILDEMERYIYTPGWKKQPSAESFRKAITSKLDSIFDKISPKEETAV
jgi:hypothetical protein